MKVTQEKREELARVISFGRTTATNYQIVDSILAALPEPEIPEPTEEDAKSIYWRWARDFKARGGISPDSSIMAAWEDAWQARGNFVRSRLNPPKKDADPCPFCGRQPTWTSTTVGDCELRCMWAECKINPKSVGPDRQTVAEQWNNRAADRD